MVFTKPLVDVDICYELFRFLDPQMKIWIKLIKTKNKKKSKKINTFYRKVIIVFKLKKQH